MENIIAVFRNRSHAMQLATSLKKVGINSKIVNTPRELSVECGISVIVNYRFLREVNYIINSLRFNSNVKLYAFNQNDIFKKYRSL
jgi:hypothetical protein